MEDNILEVKEKKGINVKDIIFVALYFIVMELILAIPIMTLIMLSKMSMSTGLFIISNIKFVVLFILGIIWYKDDVKRCYIDFKTHFKKFLGIILLFLVAGFIVDILVSSLITIPESANQTLVDEMFENFPIVQSISVVIFAPFIEEIVFRHILIGKLSSVISLKFASIMSCVFFAFIHSGFTVSIVSYLIISICLTFVYVKTGKNLIASMFFHFLWNLIALLLMIFI